MVFYHNQNLGFWLRRKKYLKNFRYPEVPILVAISVFKNLNLRFAVRRMVWIFQFRFQYRYTLPDFQYRYIYGIPVPDIFFYIIFEGNNHFRHNFLNEAIIFGQTFFNFHINFSCRRKHSFLANHSLIFTSISNVLISNEVMVSRNLRFRFYYVGISTSGPIHHNLRYIVSCGYGTLAGSKI